MRSLLGRVRERALEAYAHQDIPFEKLVEELKPERDVSRSPLFQVMFNFLEGAPDPGLPGLATRFATLDLLAAQERIETKFDLTLNAWSDGPRVGLLLEYNADLFDAGTARRMLEHLRIVLEGMGAGPDQPIGTLPLLTPAEREQIVGEWNRTEAPYPLDSCLHELIEAQAARTPDRVAVEFEGADAHLSRARRPRQPARACAGGAGGGCRGAGGRVPGALARDGGGASGRSQDGGGVRAAGSDVSEGPPGVHAGGLGDARAHHAGAPRGGGPGGGGEPAATGRGGGGRLPGPARGRSGGGHSRQPGLRHLHLGLDGAPEGRGGPPPGGGQFARRHAAGAGADGGGRAAGGDHAVVRHRRAGAVPAADGRGAGGPVSPPRGHGRSRAGAGPARDGRHRDAGDAGDLAAAAGRGLGRGWRA